MTSVISARWDVFPSRGWVQGQHRGSKNWPVQDGEDMDDSPNTKFAPCLAPVSVCGGKSQGLQTVLAIDWYRYRR
jgi:hypothetical protein